MQTYKVEFLVHIDDNDPSEPDWIWDIVQQALNSGERVENFNTTLVTE